MQVAKEADQEIPRSRRDKIRKTKIENELHLAREDKDNQRVYKYTGQKRKSYAPSPACIAHLLPMLDRWADLYI